MILGFFNKYFKKEVPSPPGLGNAWHIPHRIAKGGNVSIIQGEVQVDEVKNIAGMNNITVTEYLASAYLASLQKIWEEQKKQNNS